ncbi:hypothetical protein [[Phormidium] sp. ETS-05]|nr:hypothetical protein [[Phormidium] sp. ETS-05]
MWVNKPPTKSPPPIHAPVKGSGATDRASEKHPPLLSRAPTVAWGEP